MTSFLATNWLKKTLKSLLLVRKLFPRARLIANSRILIFKRFVIQMSFPTLNNGLNTYDKLFS